MSVLASTAAGGLDAGALIGPQIESLATTSAVVIGAAVGLGFAILAVRKGVGWVKSFTN